jgi:hypothetical protein
MTNKENLMIPQNPVIKNIISRRSGAPHKKTNPFPMLLRKKRPDKTNPCNRILSPKNADCSVPALATRHPLLATSKSARTKRSHLPRSATNHNRGTRHILSQKLIPLSSLLAYATRVQQNEPVDPYFRSEKRVLALGSRPKHFTQLCYLGGLCANPYGEWSGASNDGKVSYI